MSKTTVLVLLLIVTSLFFAEAQTVSGYIQYCCVGATSSDSTAVESVQMQQCTYQNTACYSFSAGGTTTTGGTGASITDYDCYGSGSCSSGGGITCCTSNNCNCPSGTLVHKTINQMTGEYAGDMRSIMYPVLGLFFGISWIILAFLGAALPHSIIILIIGIIDAVLGAFLIFVPATTYLGLYYVALGAIAIANIRHGSDTIGTIVFIGGVIVAFLLTGGLTVVNSGGDFVDQIVFSIPNCEASLDITSINTGNTYYNLNTRCENYALFVMICVFVLFLLQPSTLICAFFLRGAGGGSGGGSGGSGGGSGGGSSRGNHPPPPEAQKQDEL